MKKRKEGSIHGTWVLLFLLCFAFGICLTTLWRDEIIVKNDFLGEYMLLCISRVHLNYMEYFLYLLQKRAGCAILLAVLSSTYLGLAAIYIYIGWLGMASGIFLTGAGIRYGTKGILLFLGGMIPHQLILVPAGIILICWCYQMCAALYYPNRAQEPVYGNKKQFFIRKFIQFQIILGVVIIGCLLECYVNPYIITKLLKMF